MGACPEVPLAQKLLDKYSPVRLPRRKGTTNGDKLPRLGRPSKANYDLEELEEQAFARVPRALSARFVCARCACCSLPCWGPHDLATSAHRSLDGQPYKACMAAAALALRQDAGEKLADANISASDVTVCSFTSQVVKGVNGIMYGITAEVGGKLYEVAFHHQAWGPEEASVCLGAKSVGERAEIASLLE